MKVTSNSLLREELKRQKKRGKKARLVFLVIVIILAVLYVAGIVFFRTHFYSRGTVFGVSMQWESADELKEKVSAKLSEYYITVVTRDGDEIISAGDIGLSYNDQGEVDELLDEQNPALWVFMSLSGISDTDITTSLDEDMLSRAVKNLSCMQTENMTAPTDAHLEYTDDGYVIRDATFGNTLIYDNVYQAVYDAVTNGESEVILDEYDCYQAPEVVSDDSRLTGERDQLNNALSMVITYDFDDRQMVLDSSTLAAWIVMGDDFTFGWDEDAVEEYVYQMAYKTDTLGLSRSFTTHGGTEITLKGGDYGWLIGQTSTKDQLLGLLEAGESATVEPVYRYTAMSRATDDIGKNYVEVSISAQNMWVYKDGVCIVDTPVVTGTPTESRATPSGGVWAVDAKTKDYMLTGQGYSSHVDYWLPFNGNVGIHDASWRSSFGGDIYKTNGSHGCVNTPPSVMKTVYENVEIGYPVIVY